MEARTIFRTTAIAFLALILSQGAGRAQSKNSSWVIDFETPSELYRLQIDTTNPGPNLWQIGHPQKQSFAGGFNSSTAIVTDTLNPYATDNLSRFEIWTIADWGDVYGGRALGAFYRVKCDSLNDYGSIYLSPDNGMNWYDLLDDSSMVVSWYQSKPVLTGDSKGWKEFDCFMPDLGSVFGVEEGDTIRFRFDFVSDAQGDSLDGLMYDNIQSSIFVEGMAEMRFQPIRSKAYPNPSGDRITIAYENPEGASFELAVYNMRSILKIRTDHNTGDRIDLDLSTLPSGAYIYKLTDWDSLRRSWGKIVVGR